LVQTPAETEHGLAVKKILSGWPPGSAGHGLHGAVVTPLQVYSKIFERFNFRIGVRPHASYFSLSNKDKPKMIFRVL